MEKYAKGVCCHMKGSKSMIYIACPAHIATGGTEALHVLCFELLKLGIKASMFYYDVIDSNTVVAKRFLQFNTPYVLSVEDSSGSAIVIPETRTDLISKFPLMKKYVWWLSVDNYVRPFKICGPRDLYCLIKDRVIKRNVDFNDRTLFHLCQSYYAMDFVKKQGAENVYFLMDYLGQEHCSGVDIQSQRENVVLYNPAKGRAFTRKIIKAAPEGFKFVALQNMSPEEVHKWSNKAKVYIDFGNHPGKDRFPREAAMAGCIVITSKRGSAAFYEDIPINEFYKFKDSRREIPRIISLISDCMTHYDERRVDFDGYRNFIKEDRTRFIEQVKAVFI
jgi:hypothetical protein